jgi:hypothetical protein
MGFARNVVEIHEEAVGRFNQAHVVLAKAMASFMSNPVNFGEVEAAMADYAFSKVELAVVAAEVEAIQFPAEV